MDKIEFGFTLFLIGMFLVGVFAFVYGWPSFMENIYTYEKNGVTYEVHEFPWIKDSYYNYGIGLGSMFASLMLIIMMWQSKHDNYDGAIY